MIYAGKIKLPYKWAVGETGSRFLTELRDHRRIWGGKCPSCNQVYVPPKKVCGRCLAPIGEWVEVGKTGTVLTFTVVHYHEPAIHPFEPPFVYGIIKLDGADTGLVHLLGEADLEEFHCGMRVEAVFRDERKADILDIAYFRPLK